MRKKLLLIACGLLLPVALLALLEGGLALFGVGEEHLYDDPFVGFAPGSPLFVPQTLPSGERVYVTNPGKRAFFNEQRFPAEKAPGTYRIFALGGSTTAGRPYDDRVSFSRWLERYAAAADPTRRWEVINAGADSYASYRIVVLMKELLRYSPDLFVVYTGHNEFLEERSYPQFAHQSPALLRLRTWLSGFRFAALARQAFGGGSRRTVLPDEVTTRLDVWKGLDAYHRDDELERDVVEHFDANLERMVALARDHGVGLVFVAPVSNLKDFSPFKSEHRADLADQDRARFDAAFGEGKADLADGDPRAALARFDEAAAIDPDYADLQFRRGRALFALGDFAGRRAAFVRAKDLDVAPLRALEPIVAAVGDVARRHGVPLIDLPALLAADCRAKYGHDVLGAEYLVDHVHPDMAVHSLIAERLLDLLVERGAAHPGASWSAAARQRIYDREVASLDRRYYAERDLKLAKVLGWAGKLEEAEPPLLRAAEVLTDDPDLHLELGTLYEKTGRFQPAAGELERAVALDPASPPAHFNLGVTYGQLGRFTDGIGQLQEALRLRPDYAEALYNLGVLQREAGDLPAAIATLERVRAIRPGAAEVHRALGLAYRRAGRDADAATELTEAVRLDPRAGTHPHRAGRGARPPGAPRRGRRPSSRRRSPPTPPTPRPGTTWACSRAAAAAPTTPSPPTGGRSPPTPATPRPTTTSASRWPAAATSPAPSASCKRRSKPTPPTPTPTSTSASSTTRPAAAPTPSPRSSGPWPSAPATPASTTPWPPSTSPRAAPPTPAPTSPPPKPPA